MAAIRLKNTLVRRGPRSLDGVDLWGYPDDEFDLVDDDELVLTDVGDLRGRDDDRLARRGVGWCATAPKLSESGEPLIPDVAKAADSRVEPRTATGEGDGASRWGSGV